MAFNHESFSPLSLSDLKGLDARAYVIGRINRFYTYIIKMESYYGRL